MIASLPRDREPCAATDREATVITALQRMLLGRAQGGIRCTVDDHVRQLTKRLHGGLSKRCASSVNLCKPVKSREIQGDPAVQLSSVRAPCAFSGTLMVQGSQYYANVLCNGKELRVVYEPGGANDRLMKLSDSKQGAVGMCNCSPRWIAVAFGLLLSAGLAYGGPVYALNPTADESADEPLQPVVALTDPALQHAAAHPVAREDAEREFRASIQSHVDAGPIDWPSYVEDNRESRVAAKARPSHAHMTFARELISAQVIPLPNPLAASVLMGTLLILKAIASRRRGRFAS